MPLIFLFFIAAEILSIVMVASSMGVFASLLIMLATFVIGIFMLRYLGLAALAAASQIFSRPNNNVSFYQMLWPVRYVFAAMFFLSPGFFSDLLAILILIPLPNCAKPQSTQSPKDPNTIDVEYREIDSSPSHLDRKS